MSVNVVHIYLYSVYKIIFAASFFPLLTSLAKNTVCPNIEFIYFVITCISRQFFRNSSNNDIKAKKKGGGSGGGEKGRNCIKHLKLG